MTARAHTYAGHPSTTMAAPRMDTS
ncbi:MAG: hypothetical protein QOE58_1388, partial [Actinomycetota bacterium]|nr:hypothetical protein [Actinomycetota bacterium]